MISVKYALIIVVAFASGIFFASPLPQAIAAVIATDVQCTGCVGNADIASSAVTTTKLASNSVNGGKISDGTISAADLGPDSVGASELKGLSKLIFATCSYTFQEGTGGGGSQPCTVTGARVGDHVIATLESPWVCGDTPDLHSAEVASDDLIFLNFDFDTGCPGDQSHLGASVTVFKQ